MKTRAAAVSVLATLALAGQASGHQAAFELADWTAINANVATGTLLGQSVTLSGSSVPGVGSVLDGTSPEFDQPHFSPRLAQSDVLYIEGFPGFSYTVAFGAPVQDPVLHVSNLASTLQFPAGTQVTKVSGQDTFTVSGSSVVGFLAGSSDASGTVRIAGVHSSLSFTAVPVYSPATTPDGMYVHVGGSTPAAPPPPAPPAGPENVTAPAIASAGGGAYTCDPGTWRNVPAGAAFTYRWLRLVSSRIRRVLATTQQYTPAGSAYGYPVLCEVSVAGIVAASPHVLFSSAGLNVLPPAYGDVRIRGIDVFQTVQPNTGARMFGYEPNRAFPRLCSGGTPTSWLLVPFGGGLSFCDLQTRQAQFVNYDGLVLDQDKLTLAVVYVDVAGAPAGDPNLTYDLELIATRTGGSTPLGEPVVRKVKNPPQGNQPWVEAFERDNTDPGDANNHGIPVHLPSAWFSNGGTIRLKADLRFPASLGLGTASYGTRQCDEASGCVANDTFSLHDVPFARSPDLRIAAIEMRRVGDGQATLAAPDKILSAARNLFPGGGRMQVSKYRTMFDVSRVDDLVATAVAGTNPQEFSCNSDQGTGITTRGCRMDFINDDVESWIADHPARRTSTVGWLFPRDYDVVFAAHDYMTGQDGDGDGNPNNDPEPGWSRGGLSIRNVGLREPRTAGTTPFMTASARVRPLTAAGHELGHILTAPHASGACTANVDGPDAGTDPDAGPFEPWPELDTVEDRGRLQGVKAVVRGRLSRKGYLEATVDGLRPPATPGGTAQPELYDLMSYCTGGNEDVTWLSPRNWNRFRDELDKLGGRVAGRARLAGGATLAQARTAFAVGHAGPDYGQIARVVPPDGDDGVPASVPSSPVRLRSLDATGRVLLDAGVEVRASTAHGGNGSGPFTGPVATDAAAVELVRDGSVLDRVTRSRPPSVAIVAPRRGTRVRSRGALNVRWRASDPDRDALDATVDFSGDGGRSWRTVFKGPDRGRARVPAAFLAGSRRARIRVGVSDGFNERTATSQPFVAQGTRPRVEIVTPQAGALLRAGERTFLTGSAVDDVGRRLGGRALTWFAGRKRLGRGERIRVRLPRTARRVRLVARDRSGRTSSATLRIRVEAVQLRIVSLAVPPKVGRRARSMKVRIRTSAPATLSAAGRRYRLAARRRTIAVPLPRKPAIGVVSVRFTLTARGGASGTVRGTFSIART